EIWAAGETPADSGTWRGDFTKLYAKVRATLSDKNFAYVAELEDSEDQLLKAFDKALLDEETTPHAHTVITRYMPEVRLCHDIMRARKIALKKAA
ncbi:MAG: PA2169 family four-helix-bundle protein, partial [Lysobacteraceae bacterium]